MVYSVTVHFQFLYASRMDQSLQFFSNRLYQDHQTGYFNTAAGTSCTGAYQHKKHQDRPWDFRPLVKVCSRVSGGGDNRAYLESSLLESLSEAGVLIGHHYGDHNDRYQDDAEIPADFFNRKCFLEFFLKDQIVGAEVNTKEDHGDGHYYLQVYGIAGHTVVFDPESSGSGRTKGNGQSIKKRHASNQQEDDLYNGHSQIYQVQGFGCGTDSRGQFIYRRSRALCFHQVHMRTASCDMEDRKQENQDTHTPDPVGEASPEKHTSWKRFNIFYNAGSCGGKTGHCLE